MDWNELIGDELIIGRLLLPDPYHSHTKKIKTLPFAAAWHIEVHGDSEVICFTHPGDLALAALIIDQDWGR